MSHRSTDGACCCAGGLDSVQQDSGHLELLAEQYSFARLAAAHLLSLQPQPRITAAVVDASNAATGCRRVTAGGGFWHGPRAPPPPLPLLAPTEAPTKSLFYCRERDRRRFTAAEYRFRLRALENARNAYKVARAHRSSAHAHGHVPMLKHACMALLCSRVPVPSTVLEYRQDTSLWCLEFVAKLKKEEAAVERTREPLIAENKLYWYCSGIYHLFDCFGEWYGIAKCGKVIYV